MVHVVDLDSVNGTFLNGERLLPPPGSAVIHAGDSLFAFGSAEAVNSMITGCEKDRDDATG